MLVGAERFELNLSVPLVLEYEDAAMRLVDLGFLTTEDVGDILDYLCSIANHREVFYHWRPFLSGPGDDMVLELAVTAGSDFIVTHNTADFGGAERLGQAGRNTAAIPADHRRCAMSNISLRLPKSLHETARDLARRESISMNQFITLAVAEKVAALMTREYLEARAQRGNREAFERAMAKVPDVEPEEFDRLT